MASSVVQENKVRAAKLKWFLASYILFHSFFTVLTARHGRVTPMVEQIIVDVPGGSDLFCNGSLVR